MVIHQRKLRRLSLTVKKRVVTSKLINYLCDVNNSFSEYVMAASKKVLPFANNKKAKPNIVTVVGLPIATDEDPEPNVEYAGHFKSSEKGLAIGAGVSDIIDDTESKDAVLVSKSDGSPNNTSADVGTHRVC